MTETKLKMEGYKPTEVFPFEEQARERIKLYQDRGYEAQLVKVILKNTTSYRVYVKEV